jgi:riboflavin kinase/FMN adenylyltransferase
MRAVTSNESESVVSVGTFDGVHLGHQKILAEVRRQADDCGLEAVAYAFPIPPRRQLMKKAGRFLLLPERVKSRLLLDAVDRVVRAPFAEIRNLAPDRFVESVLVERLNAASIVVGPSFRFGARRAGDPTALRALGARYGFSVTVVPPVSVCGEPVNSSRIRVLVEEGDVEVAAALLGRPPVLIGEVASNEGFGQTLGLPTANLDVDPNVLLPDRGVYAARMFVGGDSLPRPALLYVGARPTITTAPSALRCEAYLLDPPDAELVRVRIEVHLLERMREDRQFPSVDKLRTQIDRDITQGRKVLARHPSSIPIAG